ncbi:MAG: zinc ribbon domain-containing protein [Anaerolineales bacterium]|jgi:putative FmdB family regulatory protein
MPIYEYICLDCKKEYEILRSYNESDQPLACDECGGENVKRKLSVFFAQSGGSTISGAGGCNSCAGGNCGSCGV